MNRSIRRNFPIALWLLAISQFSLAAGFDRHFVVKSGDLDNDGDVDIFLQHKAPIVLIGLDGISVPIALDKSDVAPFLLRNSGGAYVLEQAPASADLAIARQWSESQSMEVLIGDITADSALDALIDITDSTIAAPDQFIISSSSEDSPPAALRAVDQPLEDFFDALNNWYQDGSYYDITLQIGAKVPHSGTTSSANHASFLAACEATWSECDIHYGYLGHVLGGLSECIYATLAHGIDPDIACYLFGWHFVGVLQQQHTVQDLSSAPIEAARFISRAENPGPYDIEDVADVLEGVLLTTVGGLNYDGVETDETDEPDERLDRELMDSLLGTWRLLYARGAIQNLGTPGTIYVTKRRVILTRHLEGWQAFNDQNWHAALNYVPKTFRPTGLTPVRVIAAYQDDNKLVSKWNDPSELNNEIVGALESQVFTSAVSLWAALIKSNINYDDELPYDYPPTSTPGAYNSNGFAAGIIDSVFGDIVGGSISGFFLGDKPVPVTEFE